MLNIAPHIELMQNNQKIFKTIICAAAIAITFFACKNDETTGQGNLMKNGSTILIMGSESEMKLVGFLTSEYLKEHPGIKIELSGGGSAIGIDALINNQAHIANTSRAITKEEMQQAKANGVNPLQLIIAMDAVSIITNPKVGIDSLSLNQLSGLFSGKIKNWKEVGGADQAVIVIGRNENSGSYHYLLDHLRIDGYAQGSRVKAGNKEIVEEVSKQEGAIGYVNLGSIYDDEEKPCKTVWVASIYVSGGQAYSPYQMEFVRNGEYPLARPLYQYINAPVSKNVEALLRYELSANIQTHLHELGYFPITSIYKTINKKNGF